MSACRKVYPNWLYINDCLKTVGVDPFQGQKTCHRQALGIKPRHNCQHSTVFSPTSGAGANSRWPTQSYF